MHTATTKTIFVPMDDMGLLSKDFDTIASGHKRARRATFNRIKRVLQAFGLVHSIDQVNAIACGLTPDGTYVAVISIGVNRSEH